MDFYFDRDGDIKLAPNGDIAITEDAWRDTAQQAYIRVMTEPGDWTLYPLLGADLSQLYGMPQSLATAEAGKQLIMEALKRENRFSNASITIKAFPTSPQSIRFDIYIASKQTDNLILSVEQSLGIQG